MREKEVNVVGMATGMYNRKWAQYGTTTGEITQVLHRQPPNNARERTPQHTKQKREKSTIYNIYLYRGRWGRRPRYGERH